MTINKLELANALFNEIGFNKKEALKFVNAFFDAVADELATGATVKLAKFGTFNVRFKHDRIGRNPQTGEQMIITKRHVIVFSPSPALKVRISKNG